MSKEEKLDSVEESAKDSLNKTIEAPCDLKDVQEHQELGQYLRFQGAEKVIATRLNSDAAPAIPTTLRIGRIWGEGPEGYIMAELVQYDQYGFLLVGISGNNISVPIATDDYDLTEAWRNFEAGTESLKDLTEIYRILLNSPQTKAHVR